jgi:glyoxylase-like metal-dependent hydrolase (beta-lactamase superfamily II)
MKVLNLTEHSTVYTSNVYLVLGTWNALPDVNTLVDVGRDPAVIQRIQAASTGLGKKRVEQVILTHGHYDHASLLSLIREAFNPVICACSSYLEGVDRIVQDGELLKVGDRVAEIIYTPGHSTDSICLYCAEEKVLFAGDTPLIIRRPGDTYQPDFVQALEKLAQRDIQTIYFGHGQPLHGNCTDLLHASLTNVKKSTIR